MLRASALVLAFLSTLAAGTQDHAEPLRRAQELLQAGQHDAAIRLLTGLLAQQPDDPQLHYWLGQAQFVAGQVVASIPHLERALAASDGSGAVQFILGQAYLETGRLLDADRSLAAAQAERPSHAPIWLFRGLVCHRAGRLEGADEYFARASELAPDWELPLVRRGVLALDRGDPASAAALLERAAELRPEDAQILLVLANARGKLQEPMQALELVRRAAAVAPDFEPAQRALLERLDVLNRSDELLATIEDVLVRSPGNRTALYQRARLRSLNGNVEAALGDVEAALGSLLAITQTLTGAQPGDRWKRAGELRPQAMQLRAELLSRLGRTDDALAAAQQLVRDHPAFADGHFLLGSLLRRADQIEASRAALEHFKALSDARLGRSAAMHSLETGDAARAAEQFTAVLARAPRDADSIIGLARARRLLAEPATALELLATARSIGAPAASWYEQQVLALAEVGRVESAAAMFQEARSLGLELTPEVWAAVIPAPSGCAGAGA